jgi:hypothetical protein
MVLEPANKRGEDVSFIAASQEDNRAHGLTFG